MGRFIASFCLIAASPTIFLIFAVLVLLGQKPFFLQIRIGRFGQPFTVFKFRTLFDPAQGSGPLAAKRLRIARRFGQFLRRSSLDELPQLLNVIRGEMAFVGPRPLIPSEHAGMPGGGTARSVVLPGITGLSQILGGQLISNGLKYYIDLQYILHRSWVLDLNILILTLMRPPGYLAMDIGLHGKEGAAPSSHQVGIGRTLNPVRGEMPAFHGNQWIRSSSEVAK